MIYYLVINAVTFFLYWWDKLAARRGGERVAEIALLAVGLAGGTPAGLIAQWSLRHKIRKTSFQIKFWMTAFIQIYILYARGWDLPEASSNRAVSTWV